MEKNKSSLSELAKSALLPQESMLEIRKGKHQLYIGIPKETSFQENRVPLVPSAVSLLVNNGHEIVIETGAGKSSNFSDNEYSEAGAKIAYDATEVYKADIVLKVAPPSIDELKLMQDKQTLISILQISMQNENYVKQLAKKRITALAYEYLQDKTGIFTIIKAMSEIAGGTAILIAAEYLSSHNHGKGEMLGGVPGIPPTDVVILGAGTVGEFATRAALGLGATVKVFDNSLYKLRRLQMSIGQRVYTSTINPRVLEKALQTADVAVGAILATEGRSPMVVTEEMVQKMKSGSVIVDVSIDQGGCFETSRVTNHSKPVFKQHDVIHYCVPNIASRVSRTASYALSNIFTPILLSVGDRGGIDGMLVAESGVRHGVYLYKGTVTNKYISEASGMPFRDLDLLMATRF